MEIYFAAAACALGLVCLVLLLLLWRGTRQSAGAKELEALRAKVDELAGRTALEGERLEDMRRQTKEDFALIRTETADQQARTQKLLNDGMQALQQQSADLRETMLRRQGGMEKQVSEGLAQTKQAVSAFQQSNADQQLKLMASVTESMTRMQESNEKKLEQMRETVDEKLQKTLEERIGQSFKLVNDRLEQVYKGLGEMQSLATGVGDLKKVLSNVKTRGILGEIQLGAILEEILSPEQYDTNVTTKKGSSNVVEFAVKLPGDGETTVYLPIDSKFPGDCYAQLMDAYESGEKLRVDTAQAQLAASVKKAARDIRDKYIDPPATTDFGIMFLPFEGLYAEVVRSGLVEILQRDYKINVAGPTTMAALLNSLQMGFKTLAIQKRSGEVWNVLGAVKTEFGKFGGVLSAAQQRLEQANSELDKLVGVRTRQIQRKLSQISTLPETESAALLDDGTE